MALTLAKGELIAIQDPNDTLSADAFYEMVKRLQDSNIQLVYSDQDEVNRNGVHVNPHFKPDWNPELFYSYNYFSRITLIRRKVVTKIGGFRRGFEGSEEYDLYLRASGQLTPTQMSHITKVLCHRHRLDPLTETQERSINASSLRALQDFFKTRSDIQVVDGSYPFTYRMHKKIENPPLVSIIIPTYNGYQILRQAVESIIDKTDYKHYEILIIDNRSDEKRTLEYLKRLEGHGIATVLRYNAPFNYSAINNFGVSQAKGELLLLLNNDVEVINPDWLANMVNLAQDPDIGCVGAKLYYPDDTIQHGGVICGLGGVAGHAHKHFPKDDPGYFYRLVLPQTLLAVTAACLLVRKEVYLDVGGLDEQNLTVAFNDVDFCLKVHTAGYRNVWTPFAELYHHESKTRGMDDTPEKAARFEQEIHYMKMRWPALLNNDPYYNPNLTRAREDFTPSP